jgi:2-keto-4-pentenoate hydratase
MKTLEKIAEDIYQAEISKKPIQPIRTNFIDERDIDAGYKIQQLVTQKKLADGAKLIGKKIGLTSFAVQEQLGVDEPDYGILTNRMQINDKGILPYSDLMQPKAEAEWAFILKDDLDTDDLDIDGVISAIDHARVAVEIVGSRIANWNIKITDTIADNASASHFVLGDEKIKISEVDLIDSQMKLFKNGDLVSEGNGKACMGHPLKAVLWLAQTMLKRKQPLKAGDIILSGALGPMTDLVQGDNISAKIDDFKVVKFKVI